MMCMCKHPAGIARVIASFRHLKVQGGFGQVRFQARVSRGAAGAALIPSFASGVDDEVCRRTALHYCAIEGNVEAMLECR